MADRETSPAFLALPKSARHVLAAIETEIANNGGTWASVSHADLMFTHHCGAPSYPIRLLTYLGLLDRKPGRHNGAVYALSSRWQDLIETDVAKLVQLAREMRPRLQPQGAAK
jgi:hypothetical protein